MKLIRDARTPKAKSISSLKIAMGVFNGYDDESRITTVLMNLQHACEMLLKAALSQRKVEFFDKETGKPIGFERCLGLCVAHHQITIDEAGIMRAIDALPDAAQHRYFFVSEDLLYLQTRALITAYDAYLQRKLEIDPEFNHANFGWMWMGSLYEGRLPNYPVQVTSEMTEWVEHYLTLHEDVAYACRARSSGSISPAGASPRATRRSTAAFAWRRCCRGERVANL